MEAMLRKVVATLQQRWVKRTPPRPPSPLRTFPTEGFSVVPQHEKLEEENWEFYSPELFYPARIGEVLQARYQVLGKLGYGAHSTVWMARDLSGHRYVAIKICESDSVPAQRELAAYQRIDSVETYYKAKYLLRQLIDHFEIQSRGPRPHLCLVHEPLSFSVESIRCYSPEKRLDVPLAKSILRYMLRALDFLHREAEIVHGDIQIMNIHMRVKPDDSSFAAFENSESTNPVPRKVYGDRIIYESQALNLPDTNGYPVLCDLGEARLGQTTYDEPIQPEPYRAPEVIMCVPWTFSADIWNFGLVAWAMIEGKLLFTGSGEDGKYSPISHLAEMVGILGMPPKDLLERGQGVECCFNKAGAWSADVEIPEKTLEECETQLEGDEKVAFLFLIRKMLRWVPEERDTAGQLLQDAWLNSRDETREEEQ